MRWLVFGLASLSIALALVLGGTAPFGRIALSLGLPSIAAKLFVAPDWKGVALFRAERFEDAEKILATAGPASAFNLGNARVQVKAYAAALEAYDIAMAYRHDPEANVNFDIVVAFYAGTKLEAGSVALWAENNEGDSADAETGRGSARAAGTGDDVTNTGATLGVPALQSRDQRGVRKVFDDKFVVASPRWLTTLEDVPGAFLAARISHEHKRRLKAGEGQPEASTPW